MPIDQFNFNEEAYLNAYPDVAASVYSGSGFPSGYAHYLEYGQHEGRTAFPLKVAAPEMQQFFDEQSYLAQNPDVAASVYSDSGFPSGYAHYLEYGKNEGRKANFLGTPKDIALANPDIKYIDLSESSDTPESLYSLKQSNPSLYAKKIADKLNESIFNSYISNSSVRPQLEQLETIKEINPQAYYENKLKFLGQEMGWQVGQNRPIGDQTYQEVNDLLKQAQAAGLDTNQLKSTLGSAYSTANAQNQARIANEGASGGPGVFSGFTQALPMFGALGLAALTEGLVNPVTLGVTGTAGSAGSAAAGGLDAYMASAGLAPGAFEGAAFTMPNLAGYTGMADYMSKAGLDAGNFTNTALAGPTYGELGYTGLEPGQMGPTYGELGYTGLNNAQAIAAADAAAKGMTLSDYLSYANKARQGLGLANTLAKMVGGGQTSGAKSGTSGINPQQLASLLRPTNTFNPINLGQIQPKNPFIFNTQGQTKATQNMYDVSGSNPMANALRNR